MSSRPKLPAVAVCLHPSLMARHRSRAPRARLFTPENRPTVRLFQIRGEEPDDHVGVVVRPLGRDRYVPMVTLDLVLVVDLHGVEIPILPPPDVFPENRSVPRDPVGRFGIGLLAAIPGR